MLKKLLPFLLALLLLAAGCQQVYPDEYVSVNEHEAPFAYRETETEPVETETEPVQTMTRVSRAYDIREAIQALVMNGEESGEFLLVNYVGSVEYDMKNMFSALLNDSPKYSYAMDRFDWTLEQTDQGDLVRVSMKLRLTPQELQAIETRRFPGPAMNEIYNALGQQVSAFTLQVSGYQETDFVALLDDYILHHPEQIPEAPGLLASVYPDRGSLRVVEFHFVYQTDRETLRQRKEDTNSALNLICNQLSLDQSPAETVAILYKNLVPSIGYEASENATVYTQTVRKVGSSRTMASVAEYLCTRAGLDCEIVVGERDGEPWYWNRVLSEDQWWSFDLHAAALEGRSPVLSPASKMSGYTYDRDRYPEIEPPEPEPTEPEPPEPTEPTDPSEVPPEPTQPTEPSEVPSEPTEPTSTEPVEPSEPPEETASAESTETSAETP